MRSELKPGGKFPDYELPDQTGAKRKLSEIQGIDPMILNLARGHFCPREMRYHLSLAEFYPELKVGNTKVVTISTDNLRSTYEFRASVGAEWPFLSDPGRIIQKDLDIKEYTDPVNDPMIPHTFILEPELKIYKIYNGYWHWGRPSVADLRNDLRDVTSRIRPDWDIKNCFIHTRGNSRLTIH
jgi:peroxiredoxin